MSELLRRSLSEIGVSDSHASAEDTKLLLLENIVVVEDVVNGQKIYIDNVSVQMA